MLKLRHFRCKTLYKQANWIWPKRPKVCFTTTYCTERLTCFKAFMRRFWSFSNVQSNSRDNEWIYSVALRLSGTFPTMPNRQTIRQWWCPASVFECYSEYEPLPPVVSLRGGWCIPGSWTRSGSLIPCSCESMSSTALWNRFRTAYTLVTHVASPCFLFH